MQRILVIAAHPDDEVLGMGGTIAKYADKGCDITLLIVTDGSTAQYRGNPEIEDIIAEKRRETAECAKILGIGEVLYGGLPDMRLDSVDHINVNAVIERVIEQIKPDVVYTHFGGDINMDHRCVYESTIVACRPISTQSVKRLFLYATPSSTEWNAQLSQNVFMPNWYESIDEKYANEKYSAMLQYKTELREYPHPRSIEALKYRDLSEGNKVGVDKAESFVLIRCIE